VTRPVQLNFKLGLWAEEIDDPIAERMLPGETLNWRSAGCANIAIAVSLHRWYFFVIVGLAKRSCLPSPQSSPRGRGNRETSFSAFSACANGKKFKHGNPSALLTGFEYPGAATGKENSFADLRHSERSKAESKNPAAPRKDSPRDPSVRAGLAFSLGMTMFFIAS